jgi:hypothetical protein
MLGLLAIHLACAGADDTAEDEEGPSAGSASAGAAGSIATPQAGTGGGTGGSTQQSGAGGAGASAASAGGRSNTGTGGRSGSGGTGAGAGGSGGSGAGGSNSSAGGAGGASAAGGTGGSSAGTGGSTGQVETVGFEADVYPILKTNCGSCHANGFLPRFANANVDTAYGVAVDLSDTIVDLIASGDMPPACAGRDPGGQGCVSAANFELIQDWVEDDMPE